LRGTSRAKRAKRKRVCHLHSTLVATATRMCTPPGPRELLLATICGASRGRPRVLGPVRHDSGSVCATRFEPAPARPEPPSRRSPPPKVPDSTSCPAHRIHALFCRPRFRLVPRYSLRASAVSSTRRTDLFRFVCCSIHRSCEFSSQRVSMSPPPLPDQSLDTEAPNAPVTRERRLNPDLQEQLPKPCTHPHLSASSTSPLPVSLYDDRRGYGPVWFTITS
jgi:hypothetical protein